MMKFIVPSSELKCKLAVVSVVVSRRNALAIMDYALVSKVPDGFLITAQSPEAQMSASFDMAVVEGEFSPFCLHIGKLRNIVALLPDQPIAFVVDKERLEVRYSQGVFSLPMPDPALFALRRSLAGEEAAVEFSLPGDVLGARVHEAQSCTANDEFRQVRSVVLLDVNAEGVNFVATDNAMLYKFGYHHGVPFLSRGQGMKILLPRAYSAAVSAVAKGAQLVTVRADGRSAEFDSGASLLCVSLIAGNYVAYDRAIPPAHRHHVVAPLQPLKLAIKRATVMSDAAVNLAVLSAGAGRLMLASGDRLSGEFADHEIACDECTLPDGFRIGLELRRFFSLLENISTENVRICFNDPAGVVVLKEDPPQHDLTELLVPMHIDGV